MPRPPAKCGTKSGYLRHYRNREEPCDACRVAHSEACKQYRARRRLAGRPPAWGAVVSVGLKRCTCSQHEGPNPLPRDRFYRVPDNYTKDGLTADCMDCHNRRIRQRRAANPEKFNVRERAKYHAHPEVDAALAARRNAETLDRARNHRELWSEDETETALRDDISVKELAFILGRSYDAVVNRRKKARPPGARRAS